MYQSMKGGTENWEKNHRKRWIAGALALVMCCTTFISTGTFAAAETNGIYQEHTQTEEQREKDKEELIQKIEGYSQNAPVIKTGAVWNLKIVLRGYGCCDGARFFAG